MTAVAIDAKRERVAVIDKDERIRCGIEPTPFGDEVRMWEERRVEPVPREGKVWVTGAMPLEFSAVGLDAVIAALTELRDAHVPETLESLEARHLALCEQRKALLKRIWALDAKGDVG